MKRRLLAILLTLCMALSLMPVTALAATGYDDNWYHYRQKWLYSVTADKDATDNGKTIQEGQNIRETTDGSGHGTTPTIDFGTVTYGNAATNELTLKFENTTTIEIPADNPNHWGEVNVTIGSKSKYFDFKWDSKNGKINKGESSTVTITPRTDIPADTLEETVVFMEQNSRVGWSVKLTVTMAPTPVTVTPVTTIHKDYGRTLKPSDIGIDSITGGGVSADLKTLAGLGVSMPAEETPGRTDSYTLTYKDGVYGKYNITFNGSTQVTVDKATPEIKWVNASGVVYDGELGSSQITGMCVNPYTGEKVNGEFDWTYGTESYKLTESGKHSYTFTPTEPDANNYVKITDKEVFVAVGGDVTGESGGSSGSPIVTKLTVEPYVEKEYNGQPQTVPVTVTQGYPQDQLKYEYREQGAEGWTYGMPTDAGTYDVKITAQVTANYTEASTTTALIIKPREINFSIQVYPRPFNGGVEAQIDEIGNPTNILEADKSGVNLDPKELRQYIKAEFRDPSIGENKPVDITISGVKLTGTRAKNYCISDGTRTTTATIFARPVMLTVNNVTKYYGQTMTFVPSDFQANSGIVGAGLIDGDVESSIEAVLSSEGAAPTAKVNSSGYAITASSSSTKYKIERVTGTLKVEKAMPEGTVAELQCKENTAISEVASSLQGTFTNPYSGEAVPGTVIWKNGSTIMKQSGSTQECDYIFKPNDTKNYTEATGQVKVKAIEGTPAPIEIANTSLVYNGENQTLTIKEVEGVTVTVQYSPKDKDEWSSTAPKNVGAYKAKITATAAPGSGYVTVNDYVVDMVITPAVPTAVDPTGVKAGDKLSGVKLTFKGANGEIVDGTFSWNAVEGKELDEVQVQNDVSYSWTFVPDGSNYMTTSGSIVLAKAPVVTPGGSTGGAGGGGGGAGGGGAAPEEPPVEEQPPAEQPNDGKTLAPEAVVDSTGGVKAEVKAEDVASGVQSAKDSKQDSVVIAPKVEGSADKVAVEVPKSSVSDVAGAGLALKVETGLGSVTLPADSLSKLAEQAGDKVSVAVESGKDSQISIDVKVGSASVDQLDGGLSVAIPVKEGNVLVIVDGDGNETVVKKSLVDGGLASALLDGSCTVKVVDNSKDFADVAPGAWYGGAVDFASSHELFNGVSETSFAPNDTMNRAMLATVLWRLENEAAASAEEAFPDVTAGKWYTEGVAWASAQGIVTGYGDGSFGPDDNITREQLATMLYRYARQAGVDTGASRSLSGFQDGGAVSGYAADAMAWAVGAGLVNGKDGGRLDPSGSATRAEVAAVLQRMIPLLLK